MTRMIKIYFNTVNIYMTFCLLLLTGVACTNNDLSLERIVLGIPGAELEKIHADSMYASAYRIMIPQPLDHRHPEKGSFMQKIYISQVDVDRPVVFITEGYAANRNYAGELSRLLDANQIIVEHRFFGESVPDSLEWSYLTIEQAATDHHRVVQLFKKLYKGKWINSGISKGGQCSMYHRYFFPDDVNISVPYVAPLNFSVDDPKIYTFLDTVGTPECRQRIHDFQELLLKKRDVFYPMFLSDCELNNLTHTRITPEEAYEYSVLEYSFAFWQWGFWACENIPVAASSNEEIFKHFSVVGGFRYFSDEGIKELEPFFYQAMTEIGYYGYDFPEFEGFLKYVKNPVFTFSAPQNVALIYDDQIMLKVNAFLQNEANHFIYIYGGSDTWSATSVDIGKNRNSLKIYKRYGDHRTRINNLPKKQKELVMTTLKNWLKN